MKHIAFLIFIPLLFVEGFFCYSFLNTPDSLLRKAKFDQEIDALWGKFGMKVDDEQHVINASTFGEGDTNIYGIGLNSSKAIPFHAFQGIRYASAPRFQPPIQLDQYWTGDLQAKEQKEICPQASATADEESEECLFLSIYSPKLPQDYDENKETLPVMVFIHGGSFTSGSSNRFLPHKLLNHDIVLVTINYRLGTLGFFTLNDEEAPGDYALYDQREALRWVNKHISDFGGNQSRVTVFGQSAGSVSVSYMTLLADNDTIHGAISESGSTMDVWSIDVDPSYASRYVSDYVGCYDAGTDYINMTCMKEVDYRLFVDATSDMVAEDRSNGLLGFRGVSPTLQPADLDGAILTKYPKEYYEEGLAHDIPYMLGANKQEGSYVLYILENAFLIPNDLLYNTTYLREGLFMDTLASFGVSDPSHAMSNSLQLLYCPGVDLGDFYASAPCLIDMVGVMLLRAGGWETADLHSRFTTKETYFYNFDYCDGPSLSFWLFGANPPYEAGVTHADELIYLFPKPVPPLEGEELLIQDRMTLLWTTFATYGNPTPDEDESWKDLDIAQWIPYDFLDHHFLLMRNEYIMQNEFPLRWTISMDELSAGGEQVTHEPPFYTTGAFTSSDVEDSTTDTTTTTGEVDTTKPPSNPIQEAVDEDDLYQRDAKSDQPSKASRIKTDDDVQEMEDKRDAYMITMIVFIVVFVIAVAAATYFYMKGR